MAKRLIAAGIRRNGRWTIRTSLWRYLCSAVGLSCVLAVPVWGDDDGCLYRVGTECAQRIDRHVALYQLSGGVVPDAVLDSVLLGVCGTLFVAWLAVVLWQLGKGE